MVRKGWRALKTLIFSPPPIPAGHNLPSLTTNLVKDYAIMLSISLLITSFFLAHLSYRYVIYPIFISSLAKVPNAHWSSPISPIWILLKRYGERENRTIHAAHSKHGDLVRLGPNEVSIACVENGIKTVYGGGFEKWSWYPNLFVNHG